MITHLLLDADHVLINKPELWSATFARRRGIDPETFNRDVLPFFTGPFQDCLVGKTDLKEVIAPWLGRWPATGTVDELLAEWFAAEHFIDGELLEQVERLRAAGMKVYVATNQEKYRTEYMRETMGFARQFDGVLVSCELGVKKPDPVFFTAAMKQIDNPGPTSVMFWDDDAENVAAARTVGIHAEQYENLDQFKRTMKELV